jgi:lipopolysaccharide biosynthesis glycosyltransferase
MLKVTKTYDAIEESRLPQERVAICTVMDGRFMPGFVAFINSFLFNNRWFTGDLVILDNGLSSKNKKDISLFYNKVVFKSIDKRPYRKIKLRKTKQELVASYYTLETFRQVEYERIVFLDMDLIVVDTIRPLFDFGGSFGAVPCYMSRRDKISSHKFNGGVFVVNDPFICEEVYQALLSLAIPGSSVAEQMALNKYFAATLLPKTYNMEKRICNSKRYAHLLDKARIWHFVGANKPWMKSIRACNAIEHQWWKWYTLT